MASRSIFSNIYCLLVVFNLFYVKKLESSKNIQVKYGLDLNIPIEEKDKFYSIGGGTLLVNLDKKIDMSVIESICTEYKLLVSIDIDYKSTVILRDNAFANSVNRSNAIQKLKQAGIKEIRSI